MKIVITGGAGFIGSAVVRHCLLHTDHSVVNVDKLTYAANLENVKEVLPNQRYQFVQADIGDMEVMNGLFSLQCPDAVLHLAAESHVDRSIDHPAEFIGTNIVGTYVLLEAALEYWNGLSKDRRDAFRFHHVSTDEVFGTLGAEGAFTEETPYAPNSPYSSSKASSDMLVRAWHHTYGLPTLISNCSNNYGPYQFPEKLIPVVILAALDGRPIPVYGRGENVRDWLFVNDHAAALLCILNFGKGGETYNVGGGSECQNIVLVRLLCRILDELLPESPHRPHESLIEFVKDRPGHDFRYAMDARKLERELGWTPTVSLEEGLRLTVKWYITNSWWWEPIRSRFVSQRLGLRKS